MMYSADLPISTHTDDVLGRATYAKNLAHTILRYGIVDSLCLGLLGPWGSGKTSILNMMLEEIEKLNVSEKKVITIRFEPWNFTSTDQLLGQFFFMLANELLSESEKKKSELAEAIREYGNAVDIFEGLPVVGKTIATIGKIGTQYTSKKLAKGTDRKSIQEQKKVVEELLRKYTKKLLIVIDDIDRLSNDQIRQVFQLVTAVAKFPNTIYLLVFDREVVVKALEKVQEGNGNAYLEKVIQVPLNIPEVSREKREAVLFSRLDNIINTYSMRFDEQHWQRVYTACIRPFLSSLREVNRLTNLLQFKLASIASEVNFVDMVALSTVELAFPEVYGWIKTHKSLLTGVWESDSLLQFAWNAKETEIYQSTREELQTILVKNGYSTQTDLDRLCGCIKTLFPHWSQRSVQPYALDELRSLNRVAHPEKFNRYFNLDIGEIALRRTDVETALNNMALCELGKYMLDLDSQNKLDDFLSEISALFRSIPIERVKVVVRALLQYSSQFSSVSSRYMFGISAAQLAEHLVRDIMSATKDAEWGEYLNGMLDTADWDLVIGISHVIHAMILAYGRYTDNGPRLEYERVLSEAELDILEKTFVDKVKRNIGVYDILSYPKGRIPFFLLQCIDKEYTEKYLTDALSDSQNIIKYLAASVMRWNGRINSYELGNQYLSHISDDAVKNAIDTCVGNKLLFELSEYEQEAAAAYYLISSGSSKQKEGRVSEVEVKNQLASWKNAY